MRRYTLILLVLILLIINTLMQQAAEADPLNRPGMWAMRHSLPAGIEGAVLFLAALGMGAQVWRGILPLCSTAWSPGRAWSYMTVCGLWCGWIPLLCALAYYPAYGEGPSRWLIGAFIALIAARMLSLTLQQHKLIGLFCGLLAAAAAVLCGQILWPATPLDVLVMGLCASAAMALLLVREPAPQLVWLTSAALAFCAYTAAFGNMLAFYPPGEAGAASPWGMWMALIFTVVGLVFVIFALLRRTLWGRRAVAAAGLLAVAVWIWLHFTTTLTPQEQWAGTGFFALGLLLFGIPAGMLLRGAAK